VCQCSLCEAGEERPATIGWPMTGTVFCRVKRRR